VSPPRKPPPPPKKEFREIGTSPAEEPPPLLPTQQREQELPFAGLFTFASVGVDTRDLPKSPPPPTTTEEKAKSGRRKSGPPPPPKPSGPHVEAELQRRRQAELLGSLVAEFQVPLSQCHPIIDNWNLQYCLGHEPEHHPGEEPPLLERRKSQGQQWPKFGEILSFATFQLNNSNQFFRQPLTVEWTPSALLESISKQWEPVPRIWLLLPPQQWLLTPPLGQFGHCQKWWKREWKQRSKW
jgi:hypothetical protein